MLRGAAMVRFSLLSVLLVSACAGGTPNAGTSTPAKAQLERDAVVRLFELMSKEKQYTELMEQQMESLQQSSPAQAKVLREFFTRHLAWGDVKDDFIALYQNTFSRRELRDMTRFYETPAGRKTAEFQPRLVQEVSRIAVERVHLHSDDLFRMGIMSATGQDPTLDTSDDRQDVTKPKKTSHRKAVDNFFDASRFGEAYDEGVAASLSEKTNVDPDKMKVLRKFYAKHLSWKAIEDEVAQLYMQSFTESDLNAITAFHRSSTGRKVVRLEPKLSEQGKDIMMKQFASKSDQLFEIFRSVHDDQPSSPVHDL